MAVLVTGAGGFLGRAILRELAGLGKEVIAFLGPDDAAIALTGASYRGDVRDPDLVSMAIEKASSIIHLAGPASVAHSFTNPALYASVHIEGTRVVFEAARRANLARAVLISSAEVYGQPQRQPANENTPLAPRSPYGQAKVQAEGLARTLLGAGLTVIRPFSVYGFGMRPTSVLGRILEQIAANGPVELQTLEPVRDYVHVDDLAALVCLGLEGRASGSGVLNACSGQGVSVGELGRLVVEIAGKGGPVRSAATVAPRPGDIQRLIGDPSAALAAGWRGTRPLGQGLADLLDNLRVGNG